MKKLSLLLIGLASAATSLPASAGPLAPAPVPWVIAGDEVIEGGVHTLDMPVVVPAGSSLTIKDATVLLDWRPDPICFHGSAGVCPAGLQITGGTLRILDSTIDTNNWDPDDGWSGFKISGNVGVFDFQRSTFQHFEVISMQGSGGTASTIRNNKFLLATTALRFWRGAEAIIEDNEIAHFLTGINFQDASGIVRNNHLHDAKRIWNKGGIALNIQSTQVGQNLFTTVPLVEGNLLENGGLGALSLNGFPNTFRNNTFRSFEMGASIGLLAGDMAHKEHSVWENNIFDSNKTNIQVYVSGTPDEVEEITFNIHGNSFLGNSCTDIVRRSENQYASLTVNARSNWWGSSDGPRPDQGPTCPRVTAGVITSDWLTAPPA